MAKLLMSEDGVFPIVRDENGEFIKDLPQTGIEMAGTIQGEGKLVGMPSLFIRLAGCNLRCEWILPDGSKSRCDTAYASFDTSTARYESVQTVLKLVENNLGNIKHVVVTGGEPFLQSEALAELCASIKSNSDIHITVETNGTIFNKGVAINIDLFSISPKLSYSLNKVSVDGLVSEVQKFIDFANKDIDKDLQLKFVASCRDDEKEILEFIDELEGCKSSDILVMPAGETQDILNITSPVVLDMSIRNNWRFCNRLHVSLFGNIKGV